MGLIVDACSIILLAKAGILENFLDWKNVEISNAVYKEVIKGKEKMYYDALVFDKLYDENKIKVINVDNVKLLKIIKEKYGLGDGEAETIALYLSKNYDGLVTDNKQGRKVAKIYGINVIGCPEIIVSLYKKKEIGKTKAFEALYVIKKYGWFTDSIIDYALLRLKND